MQSVRFNEHPMVARISVLSGAMHLRHSAISGLLVALICSLMAFSANASVWYYLASAPESELPKMASDQERWESFLFSYDGPESGADHLYLEKTWHGVHWLLAQDAEANASPASQVILGGQSIGPDIGFGDVARFHSADEVKKISALLSALDPVELRKRYDPVAMASAGIDPNDWAAWDGDDREGTIKMLLTAFEDVRRFYQSAAAEGKAVVFAWN
ncbi:YfbM family protein [Stenotrophomonas sp. PS02289]|uniref:YfbM family protein n=1 Tax=Stenotrophomonas sp. PS02289 TaxID=2991422 RepID=UPI00249C4FD7|nr:YfbM family protein [Stenotrophomonas sp. PS02289]